MQGKPIRFRYSILFEQFNNSCFDTLIGTGPRAVGKRTPRVPVSFSYSKDNGEKYFSPRQRSKIKTDANDVAHEIALVLTEASQRGVSPQASHTPNKKPEGASPSAIWNGERMVIVLYLLMESILYVL